MLSNPEADPFRDPDLSYQFSEPYDEIESSREDLLNSAKQIAEQFNRTGNIKRIGIAGSLARGKEKPSDIDLVFLVDEGSFLNYRMTVGFDKNGSYDVVKQIMGMLKKETESKEKNFLFEEILGLSSSDAKRLVVQVLSTGFIEKKNIDILVLPDKIEEEIVADLAVFTQYDPTFLSNIRKDCQQFNPETGNFEPTPIYTDEEMAIINQAEFKNLKEIVTDPDHPAYKNYEEHRVDKHYKKDDQSGEDK